MSDKTRWLTPARFKLILSSVVLLGPLLCLALMLSAIWQGSYLYKTVQVAFVELQSQSFQYWSAGSRFSSSGMKQGQAYVLHYRHNGEEGFHDLSAEEVKPLRELVPGSLVPLVLPDADGHFDLNEEAQGFGVLALVFAAMVLPVLLLLWAGSVVYVSWFSYLWLVLLLLMPFRVLFWR
ncbi:hypothetical protein [Rheinheimera mangrovi]|uniref:hypothetical protein n=1 Tax=Rheinheimera mangrovi TaxID=2498451 RepID=UPI000F8EE62C|nr:hypothetical protein [Rheinheimera mangrovi]